MKKIFFLLFILVASINYGQNEANIWYFGNNAGLDFSNGDPVALTDGSLSTVEGCSSFSDQNGNLLFYSDGITVYNKNHNVMQNGNNLGGNPSSAQSGLIVPSPNDANIFYLFTVGTNAVGSTGYPSNAGFKYYTIDMAANAGLGRVHSGFVNLSGALSNNWTEKVTAVQSDGCNSIWVISLVSNTFYSFLIDENGVSSTPVISTVANNANDVRGYLKVSPDAEKIVAANMDGGTFLYDFDNTTGIVSNGNQLNLNGERGYGIEFSLNSKVLYISTGNYINNSTENLFQFNLDLPDFTAINLSRSIIHTYTNLRGALQLAPNGKIYWTSDNNNRISVINNPENLGNTCNYSHLSVDLGGRIARQGLPPFIQSLFLPNVDIINDGTGVLVDGLDLCEGDTYTLEPDISTFPVTTTYEWYKDELIIFPAITTSSLDLDGITYGTGNYKVLIDFNDGVTCPFYGEAQINYHQNPVITSPITIKQCDDDSDGFADIDLTLTNESISVNHATETITYHSNQADAENNDSPINNTNNYNTNSTGANPIWVRVENDYCYTVGEVNIIVSASTTNLNETLYKCDDYIENISTDNDGFSKFNLTLFENDLLNQFPVTQQANLSFAYYHNINDAQLQTNAITDPSTYRNQIINNEVIYIRINNNSNIDCVGMGNNLSINLVVEELPIANNVTKLKACETSSGSLEGYFDTTIVSNMVIQSQTDVTLSYFEADGTEITDFISNSYLSSNKTVTVRITNNNSNDIDGACFDETTVDLVVYDKPVANNVPEQVLCDDFPDQTDGISEFDTSELQAIILDGDLPDNMEIHYYYDDGTEILPTLPTYFNTTTQTIDVEVINTDFLSCSSTTEIKFKIVDDSPIYQVPNQLLCVNILPNPLRVEAENPQGLYTYSWQDYYGNSIPTDTSDLTNPTRTALITKAGEYSVTATSAAQCTTTINFTVTQSSIPIIETTTIFDDSPNNRVTAIVNGIGDYEFALDNNSFTDQNGLDGHVFTNVEEGVHIIRVNDKNGCTPMVEKEIIVIRFPIYISPNGDGRNDNFYVFGGNGFISSTVTIFDRYGKIITILNNNEKWNGFYLGKIATKSDYWFLAKFIDRFGKIYERKGHFSIK